MVGCFPLLSPRHLVALLASFCPSRQPPREHLRGPPVGALTGVSHDSSSITYSASLPWPNSPPSSVLPWKQSATLSKCESQCPPNQRTHVRLPRWPLFLWLKVRDHWGGIWTQHARRSLINVSLNSHLSYFSLSYVREVWVWDMREVQRSESQEGILITSNVHAMQDGLTSTLEGGIFSFGASAKTSTSHLLTSPYQRDQVLRPLVTCKDASVLFLLNAWKFNLVIWPALWSGFAPSPCSLNVLSTLLKFNKWQTVSTRKTRVSTKEDLRAVCARGSLQSVPGKNPWDSAQSWNGAVWFFPEGRTMGLWPLLSSWNPPHYLHRSWAELNSLHIFENHCGGVDGVFGLGLLWCLKTEQSTKVHPTR